MSLSLPNPNVPSNGQPLDATPILQNELAIAQAIQSFDASQIAAGTLVASAFNASINPNTLLNETTFPFVRSGCIWSAVSSSPPIGTMTGGVVYINGIRIVVNSVPSHTFAVNSDTYVDVDVNGNVGYAAVANNAASPALAANSIRLGIIVTNATAITSINQGSPQATTPVASSVTYSVSDSLGNLIYPTNPSPGLLGYRQITGGFTTTNSSATLVTGLSCTVIVPAYRDIEIVAHAGALYNTTSTARAEMSIWDGTVGSGTQLDSAWGAGVNSFAAGSGSAMAVVQYTAQATKTYNVGLLANNAGTATIAGGSTQPTYISVEIK